MKRDFDLIRLILLEIEKSPAEGVGDLIHLKIEGFTSPKISYHVGLLEQAGMIKAVNFAADDRNEWIPSGLTWDGHEFIDAARNDVIWGKAKKAIIKAGGPLTLTALQIGLKILIERLAMGI